MLPLPNPQQVKNIVGHVGTAVGTAIVLFGLQAKGIDPAKVTALINSMGDAINTIVIIIGALGGIAAAYKAAKGSSTQEVIKQSSAAISADPHAVASLMTQETTVQLAQATVDMATTSEVAKNALLEKVVELPSVQGVVVDKETAQATPNPMITADPAAIPKGT